MRGLLIASLLLCTALLVQSQPAAADQNGISVTGAWSRAAMAGRVGVVYLTIANTGAPDSLTGASSPVAARATVHETFNDNGVMKMRPIAALPVPPGKPVKLSPGGYHIMLEQLKQSLQPGQTFPVTLTFANAGAVTTTVTVRKAGGNMAMGPGGMGGTDMQGAGSHSGARTDMGTGSSPQH
jgi:periplasmic copper chaperone A